MEIDRTGKTPEVKKEPTVWDIARNKTLYVAVRAATPVIQMSQENISQATQVEYENGFWEEYGRLRTEGYVPINSANHTAQQDADSMSKVTGKQIQLEQFLPIDEKDRLKGFRLPLAQILDTGGHGPVIQAIYHADYALLQKNHLKPLLLARTKDVAAGMAKPNLIEYYKQMQEAFRKGYGIAGFFEGDTSGGKSDEVGKLNGMHSFEEDSLRSITSAAKRTGKRTMIVPVGIEGGFRIQDPITKLPTRWAWRLGLNLSDRNLLKVRVGLPIPTDTGDLGELFAAKKWRDANELVEKQIAALLPPNLRGIHR